jgi:hypothetical protein
MNAHDDEESEINIEEYEMDSIDIGDKVVEDYKKTLYDNKWTDKTEKIIKDVAQNSRNFKNEHDKLSRRYNLYSKILNIILIIFTTTLSAQTFNISTANSPLDTIKKILTIIINIISISMNFLNFDSLNTKHNIASSNFSKLYNDIQQQLIQERKDRIDGVEYIGKTLKRYDDLILSGPALKYKEITTPLDEIIIDNNHIIRPLTNKRNGTLFGSHTLSLLNNRENEPSNHLDQLTACHQDANNTVSRKIENLPAEKQKEIRDRVMKKQLEYEMKRNNNHRTIND